METTGRRNLPVNRIEEKDWPRPVLLLFHLGSSELFLTDMFTRQLLHRKDNLLQFIYFDNNLLYITYFPRERTVLCNIEAISKNEISAIG